MVQYTRGDDNQASEMMWDAGLGGGSPYVHCSCSKDHSLPAEADEDNYKGYEFFHYIDLDGQVFVEDCPGCSKKLAKYENFIWQNRNHIREYLKIRINQEKAWADQEQLLNTIAGI
jgi:hypothetical protein